MRSVKSEWIIILALMCVIFALTFLLVETRTELHTRTEDLKALNSASIDVSAMNAQHD